MGDQRNIKNIKVPKLKRSSFSPVEEPEWIPQEIRLPCKLSNYSNVKWLKVKKVLSKGVNYSYSRVLGGAGEILIPIQNLKVVSDPYDSQTRKDFTNLILTDPIAAPAHTFLIGSLFENGFTLEFGMASQFDVMLGRELTPDEIEIKLLIETQKYSQYLGRLITWKNDCEVEQLAKDLVSVAIPQGKAAGQIAPAILDLQPNQLPTFCEIIPSDDLGDPIIDVGINRKLVGVKINTSSDTLKETEKKDILRADEIVYMVIGARGLRRESKFQGVSRLEPILQVSLALKKYYQLHAPLAMISSYIAKQLVKVKPDMIDDATSTRVNDFMTKLFKANTWAMAMPEWYDGVDVVKPEVDWNMFSGIENKLATVELAQLGVPKSSQNREQDLNRDIATIQAIQFVRFTRKPLEELVILTLENQLFNPLLSHLAGLPLEQLPVRIKIKRKIPEVEIDKMYDTLTQEKNADITNGNLNQNNAQTVPDVSTDFFPIGGSGNITLKNNMTSRKSEIIDRQFEKFIDSIAKVILIRGTKTTLEEKKKLYKVFYEHTKDNFFLGHKYAKGVSDKKAVITDDNLKRINELSKQTLASWLSKIDGSLNVV